MKSPRLLSGIVLAISLPAAALKLRAVCRWRLNHGNEEKIS
jgi:hypothetical protein